MNHVNARAHDGHIESLERRILMDATAARVQLDHTFGMNGAVQPVLSQDAGQSMNNERYSTFTDAGNGQFYTIALKHFYFEGPTSFTLMRMNADGSVDPSFNAPTQAIQRPYTSMWGGTSMEPDSFSPIAIRVQADQKVIVVVRDTPFWSPDPFLVLRFNPDGSLDQSFGDQGTTTLPISWNESNPAVFLTDDGKIDLLDIAGGDSWFLTDPAVYLRQLNSDGSMDSSVGNNGVLTSPLPAMQSTFLSDNNLTRQDVGATLIGATRASDGGFDFYAGQGACVRSADDTQAAVHDELTAVHLDPAGTVSDLAVIKSEDVTYTRDPSTWQWNGSATYGAVTMDDAGRLLLVNLQTRQIERYDLNGTRDATFSQTSLNLMNGLLDTNSVSILPQHDGKIILTADDAKGGFQGIWRLNSDGSADTTFAGGQAVFGLPIADADASGDASCGIHSPFSSAREITTLPDGSVLVGTYDPVWNGSGMIVKLASHGGTANSFDLQAEEAALAAARQARVDEIAAEQAAANTGQQGQNGDGSSTSDVAGADPSQTTSDNTATDSTADHASTDGSSADANGDPLNGLGATAASTDSSHAATSDLLNLNSDTPLLGTPNADVFA